MRGLDLLQPAIRSLKAYEPEPGMAASVLLDANENPYPLPAAFMAEAGRRLQGLSLNRYPDPAALGLRTAASAYYQVPLDSLLAGNGSDEFIQSLFTAFGGPGRKVLLPTPTFSMYALCARAAGWQVLEEALDEDWQIGQAFVERARRDQPALVFLGSPNNPTGNCFDSRLIDELLALPLILVLDEAYAEFAVSNRTVQAPQRANLIVLRTLSKAFGLAGLRLGFLIGMPDLVAELNKIRLPYNIDAVAQSLGQLALASAADFAPSLQLIRRDKARLEGLLKGLKGAEVFASDANFFLFRHPGAEAFHAGLLKAGIRLRRFSGGRLENCLRVSVGTAAELDRLEAAFGPWS